MAATGAKQCLILATELLQTNAAGIHVRCRHSLTLGLALGQHQEDVQGFTLSINISNLQLMSVGDTNYTHVKLLQSFNTGNKEVET